MLADDRKQYEPNQRPSPLQQVLFTVAMLVAVLAMTWQGMDRYPLPDRPTPTNETRWVPINVTQIDEVLDERTGRAVLPGVVEDNGSYFHPVLHIAIEYRVRGEHGRYRRDVERGYYTQEGYDQAQRARGLSFYAIISAMFLAGIGLGAHKFRRVSAAILLLAGAFALFGLAHSIRHESLVADATLQREWLQTKNTVGIRGTAARTIRVTSHTREEIAKPPEDTPVWTNEQWEQALANNKTLSPELDAKKVIDTIERTLPQETLRPDIFLNSTVYSYKATVQFLVDASLKDLPPTIELE